MGALEGQVVGVIGLGYVGLPLAEAVSGAGARVIGLDSSPSVIERLSSGSSHVADVSDGAVADMLAAHATFTTDVAELASCQVFVICVPTPLKDKYPDLSAVLAATEAVGAALSADDLVVLESTTYPGTTQDVVAPLLERTSNLVPGRDFHLAFSPERIDPGNVSFGIRNGIAQRQMHRLGECIEPLRPIECDDAVAWLLLDQDRFLVHRCPRR